MSDQFPLKQLQKMHRLLKDVSDFKIFRYDLETDLKKLMEDAESLDIALLATHGGKGENGVLQGFLEMIDVPYTGSGVYSSRACMNKSRAKQIFKREGITTGRSLALRKGHEKLDPDLISMFVGFPLFVKPNSDGSSHNTLRVVNERELWDAWSCFDDGNVVLFEEYIAGVEVTCSVIDEEHGPRALTPIEICPQAGEFYDYESKYSDDGSEFHIPARVSEQKISHIQETALQCYKALDCRGYARIDMILRGDTIFVLEANTLPGFTSHSLLPKSLAHDGINPSTFLEALIRSSLRLPQGDSSPATIDTESRIELQEKTLD